MAHSYSLESRGFEREWKALLVQYLFISSLRHRTRWKKYSRPIYLLYNCTNLPMRRYTSGKLYGERTQTLLWPSRSRVQHVRREFFLSNSKHVAPHVQQIFIHLQRIWLKIMTFRTIISNCIPWSNWLLETVITEPRYQIPGENMKIKLSELSNFDILIFKAKTK